MADVQAVDVSVTVPCTLTDLDRPAIAADPVGRLEVIRRRNAEANCWTLVLDDDPTGTQTVRDVPVLTADWSEGQLDWASGHPSRTTFVLTNSRSLDGATAERLTYEIVTSAAHVARRNGQRLRVVSRSDSTLRGHFSIEVTAAHRALRAAGMPAHGTVFVPAFLEAGRMTARDIQWVSTPEGFVPAARTEFANDKTFGFDEENLSDWIVARNGATARPLSLSLEASRADDGVAKVGELISTLAGDQVLIANAVRSSDLEVLMLGLLDQEDAGHSSVIRSGPSFVRLCAAQAASEPIDPAELGDGSAPYGLVVVGSHTDLTNAQVEHARQNHDLLAVVLDAVKIVGDAGAAGAETARCIDAVIDGLTTGEVVLSTSRDVLTQGRETPLKTSAAIADALVAVVRQVASTTRPRFLIAKGGITSSDMAVRALGVHRAMVLGQMLPGTIPLWELLDGLIPELPYVVFPGNVGAPDALTHVLTKVKK